MPISRALLLLFALSVLTYLDRVCIAVSGSAIQQELGLSLEQWGWVLGSFIISYGAFEIPAGMLGDRKGPRRIITRIVLWWSGFTALTGLAQGFWSLVTARFLFGAGEAGAYPNISVAIARWVPAAQRARAQGIVWMGSRIGGALTPLVVIPIQHAFGWRNCFFIFGVVGVVWVIAWLVGTRSASRSTQSGLVPNTAGPGHASARAVVWRQWFRASTFWWILIMYQANAWCGYFFLTWMPTFLQRGRDFAETDLLKYSWLPFAFGAGGTLLGGVLSDLLVRRHGLRLGRRLLACAAYGFTAVFVGLALVTEGKAWTILWLALAFGFSDLGLPVAWAVCLDVGKSNAGALTGAMNMAGQLGAFLSTVLFGYLAGHTGNFNLPLIPIAMMSVLAAVAWLRIDASRELAVE